MNLLKQAKSRNIEFFLFKLNGIIIGLYVTLKYVGVGLTRG